MVLAVGTFIITSINGTKHYWHHIVAMPGVPKPIAFNSYSYRNFRCVSAPFVLMIRLFANMTAGHIIALSFFALIFIFGEMSTGAGFGVSIVSSSIYSIYGLNGVVSSVFTGVRIYTTKRYVFWQCG
jgi:F-type H+-transporting ATPase subunit a